VIAFGEPEAEEPVAVDLRLSDRALFDRLSRWIDEDTTLFRGAADGGPSVIVADHVPDGASGPIVLARLRRFNLFRAVGSGFSCKKSPYKSAPAISKMAAVQTYPVADAVVF